MLLVPPSVCSGVNKFDHVRTQECAAFPPDLQHILVFLCVSHFLCIVVTAVIAVGWQRFS